MSNSPNLRIISAGEAAALVTEPNLQQKLSGCKQLPQPAEQHEMHVANCCTITIVRYIDPQTDELIAIEERQVYVHDKPDVNDFTYFRIGEDEYLVRPAVVNFAMIEGDDTSMPDATHIR